jgi:hypothetical protein
MEVIMVALFLVAVSDPPHLMGVWKGYLYYIDSYNHFKHFDNISSQYSYILDDEAS